MSKTLLILTGVIGLLAGIALGPGYWAYARYFGGDALTSFEVFNTSGTAPDVTLGPVRLPGVGKGQWQSPPPVKLSPEMNPVLLRLNIDTRRPTMRGRHGIAYKVELSNGAQTLVSETVHFRRERDRKTRKPGSFSFSTRKSSTSQTVAVFDVPEAGEYVLKVEETQASEIHKLDVNEVECVFRRNVPRLNTGLCVLGFILFIGCGIALAAATGSLRFNSSSRS